LRKQEKEYPAVSQSTTVYSFLFTASCAVLFLVANVLAFPRKAKYRSLEVPAEAPTSPLFKNFVMKFNFRLAGLLSLLIVVFAFAAATTISSCTKTEESSITASPSGETPTEEVVVAPQGADDRSCTSVSDACSNATNNVNCVLYTRCKIPSLPYGLTTYAQKVAIINTQTAGAGRAAIIKVNGSQYGHIAWVKSVSGSQITIRETNWCGAYVNERTGTKSGLKITGFYKP
jgi:hypothetical protein